MKRQKYGNKPVVVKGVRFHSKGEAARDGQLQALQRAGRISGLKRQVRFPLRVNGTLLCSYVADWTYTEKGQAVVEDFKSPATAKDPVYRIKRKLMEILNNIEIRETMA